MVEVRSGVEVDTGYVLLIILKETLYLELYYRIAFNVRTLLLPNSDDPTSKYGLECFDKFT